MQVRTPGGPLVKLLTEPICDPFSHGEAPVVAIEMWNGRTIRIQLDPNAAPITVAYFLTLVQQGFYNCLKIHRVVPNFIIQGGDPLGTGDGETDCYIKGEFAENGVGNPVHHTRGAISMARQDGCDTASCQFFIMLRDNYGLDGHYAAFGHVIEGMDAVDQIAAFPTDANSVPTVPVIMRRVYIEE